MQFNSLKLPLLILCCPPFTLAGMIYALYVTGLPRRDLLEKRPPSVRLTRPALAGDRRAGPVRVFRGQDRLGRQLSVAGRLNIPEAGAVVHGRFFGETAFPLELRGLIGAWFVVFDERFL